MPEQPDKAQTSSEHPVKAQTVTFSKPGEAAARKTPSAPTKGIPVGSTGKLFIFHN